MVDVNAEQSLVLILQPSNSKNIIDLSRESRATDNC